MSDWQIQILFKLSDTDETETVDFGAFGWPRVPVLGEVVSVDTAHGFTHSGEVYVVHWLPDEKLVVVGIR